MSRKIFVIFLFIYAQCVVGQQFQKGNKSAEKTALDITSFFSPTWACDNKLHKNETSMEKRFKRAYLIAFINIVDNEARRKLRIYFPLFDL